MFIFTCNERQLVFKDYDLHVMKMNDLHIKKVNDLHIMTVNDLHVMKVVEYECFWMFWLNVNKKYALVLLYMYTSCHHIHNFPTS